MASNLKCTKCKMWSLRKIIKHRNSLSLSFLHTSTLSPSPSPSPQRHTPTRRNPTTSHYDDLVAEAGQARDFPRLRHILIERINNKCSNSKDTFNFVTKTQSSISTLDKLFDCLASLPPGAPRRSAFEVFVKRLCIVDLVDHALQVLNDMSHRKLEVNSYTYHPVIQTLTKKRDITKVVSVLERMRRNGIDPDTTSFNYVLTMFCMMNDVGNAIKVLEVMVKEKGLKGDARTYDAMVIGACRVGKVEGAVGIVRVAVEDGVTLMHCTYEHVIKALLNEGFYELGLKFVLCFAGRMKRLDDVNFDVLVNGLIDVGRFKEAKMVVDEKRKIGLFMGENSKESRLLHGLM